MIKDNDHCRIINENDKVQVSQLSIILQAFF